MSALRQRSERAEARAESQRERILDAAQKCFIDYGFHGATVATIAEQANMSAGLLYRYFESKNAIMLAIIARELENARARIDTLCGEDAFLDTILAHFRAWQTGAPTAMNATMFLEISAEASRSSDIARAVRTSDTLVREEFQRWLQRDRGTGGTGLAPEEAQMGALVMQCLVEGLLVRALRDPELDPDTLRKSLVPVLAQMGLLRSAPVLAAQDQKTEVTTEVSQPQD